MGLLGGALLSAQWRVCRFGVPDVNPQAVLKRAYLGLLKPRSACHDSKLIRRVKTIMANARNGIELRLA